MFATAACAMAPCQRGQCRHCGVIVSVFCVDGFGVARRRHEARCARAAAAAVQPLPKRPAPKVLPGVSRARDASSLALMDKAGQRLNIRHVG